MTSAELRQSFLDFFEQKQHHIVPSASLMPTSPNLLFTNAGMNQFVPYFLGEQASPWPRIADTQKCIRAGGKHNDLEDVGFDTYHHTLFEMLGNWSFGDYFKQEAIEWAWELLTTVWKLPKERLYATIYKPGEGDPADFDQEAHDYWKAIFEREGMDPAVHIVNGNKKDNFWMMGETGPCGPCSEVHIDLTEKGDTAGKLVNADSPWCIEIWNLVFIQFNAEASGDFKPLAAKHVDTGMGFERVAGMMATTKNFTDFSQPPSNYNSDLFTDLFAFLEGLSGKRYEATMPEIGQQVLEGQELIDCAFRVLADHIRTLSFSIADGILPGNEGRNYVLRRILRRAILWGKRLELSDGFFAKMVDPLVEKMGSVFPELRERQEMIRRVIETEENAFERTLDRGLKILEERMGKTEGKLLAGTDAFELYDTYGFPLDLTQLLAREKGFSVDLAAFNEAMEAQKERARAAQKKEIIEVSEGGEAGQKTDFVGFEVENLSAFKTAASRNGDYILLERSPFYAEMGGQVGDTGTLTLADGTHIEVADTLKQGETFLHQPAEGSQLPETLGEITVQVDLERRAAIQRHHSATHILHWALRKVLGTHVQQAGSYVGPERLRFDFSHYEALSDEQLGEIERLVNERVVENAGVQWFEVPFNEKPEDVIAFFGDKYGENVRVVDIGGYSKELCGGTHVRATGEIGLFKIVDESAIAAGTRRIEAICGLEAYQLAHQRIHDFYTLSQKLKCTPDTLGERVDKLLDQQAELEKQLRSLRQKAAAEQAGDLASNAIEKDGLKWLVSTAEAGNPNELRGMAVDLSKSLGEGVVVLGSEQGKKVSVLAMATPAAVEAGHKAGDLVRELAGALGGKGGGKPDFAMGGAANEGKLEDVLKTFRSKLEG